MHPVHELCNVALVAASLLYVPAMHATQDVKAVAPMVPATMDFPAGQTTQLALPPVAYEPDAHDTQSTRLS